MDYYTNDSGNGAEGRGVIVTVRDPVHLKRWMYEITGMCNNKDIQALTFQVTATDVHIFGCKKSDSQNVVQGHMFEFPKPFFTCLKVTRNDRIDIVIGSEALLATFNKQSTSFSMRLTDGELKVNGNECKYICINRRGLFRSLSLSTRLRNTPTGSTGTQTPPISSRTRSRRRSMMKIKQETKEDSEDWDRLARENTAKLMKRCIMGMPFDIRRTFPGYDVILADDSINMEDKAERIAYRCDTIDLDSETDIVNETVYGF